MGQRWCSVAGPTASAEHDSTDLPLWAQAGVACIRIGPGTRLVTVSTSDPGPVLYQAPSPSRPTLLHTCRSLAAGLGVCQPGDSLRGTEVAKLLPTVALGMLLYSDLIPWLLEHFVTREVICALTKYLHC